MTNFDVIKSKNVDELTEWLNKYCDFFESPWLDWFDCNYCKKCKPETAEYLESGRETEFAWCELNDYRCRFFQELDSIPDDKQMIKMWLESECKNE